MTDVGGFTAVLWETFFIMGIFINHRYQTMYLIQDLFYIMKPKYENDSQNIKNCTCLTDKIQSCNFNSMDKFSLYKTYVTKKLSDSEEYFNKAEKRLQKELNFMSILQMLQKIRAAISVLAGNDNEIEDKIQELYIKNSIIWKNQQL